MGIRGFNQNNPKFRSLFTRALGGDSTGLDAATNFEEIFTATGGTTYVPGNGYKYHVFTNPNSANFVVSGAAGPIEALIVAGGGGGTGEYGPGGAGGGGVVHVTSYTIPVGNHPVVVGAGGAVTTPDSSPTGPQASSEGGDSSLASITALGGGSRIPGNPSYERGSPGGSGAGGGGTADQPSQSQPIPAPSYTQYGNAGGTGSGGSGSAGGGGAGGAGSDPLPGAPIPQSNPRGGPGGHGQPFPAFAYPLVGLGPIQPVANSPSNDHYGGGGGGWGYQNTAPNGGYGGGGDGHEYPTQTLQQAGVNGLGGGAGGFVSPSPDSTNKAGGDGIVIVRYQV